MKLVKLQTYSNYFEANIILQRLQHEGINAFIFDENINTIHPGIGFGSGGIKLMVPSVEFIIANNILLEIEKNTNT